MIVGSMLGLIISNTLQSLEVKQVLKIVKKELARAYEEGVKFGVVQLKIDRINEISKEQAKYMGSLDQPSASAAHSRHKNSIVSQIKALEQEKIELFSSILDSGADPMLKVAIDGEVKNLRASELLPYLKSEKTPSYTPQSKTDSNTPGSTRTLRIVSDTEETNDDDSESNPSNPEIH